MLLARFFIVASLFLAVHAAAQEPVQRRGDTVSVFFPLDVRSLTPAARRDLDELQYQNQLERSGDFYVIGYADYVGRASYNDTLSQERAEAVQEYLLASGFKESRLRVVTGRGEVPRADSFGGAGFAPDRRVDIVRAAGGFKDLPPATSKASPLPLTTQIPSGPDTGRGILPIAAKQSIQRLLTVPKDSAVALSNLYFPPGRHYVYPGSRPVLDALAETLLGHPSLRVRIEGHVCCIDPNVAPDALDEDTHEFALSLNRAKAIAAHLVSKGVPADRLETAGFGKQKPVVRQERTAMDTERNRRVEIRVISR